MNRDNISTSPSVKYWKQFPKRDKSSGSTSDSVTSCIQLIQKLNKFKVPVFATPLRSQRTSKLSHKNWVEDSFEVNQSFPKAGRNLRKHEIVSATPKKYRINQKMDKIRVDGYNGLRFTPYRPKGCFTPNSGSPYNNSFLNPASESLMRIPKTGINPNKAVFTIDSKTSHILIVNNNACELLSYSSRELCDSKFSNLLASKNKTHVSALAENQFNSDDGTMILLSGKVVEMITKHGQKIPVSLWIRQIDNDGRCLAVAEPVERRVAQLLIDNDGFILSGDNEALMLFQLESLEKFVGMDITLLIPAIQLPDSDTGVIHKNIRKQRATGKTCDGVAFPLCLMVSAHENECTETGDEGLEACGSHMITIWVYSNLSGLIVIDENSIIESCNHHFSTLMFGFPQNKIVGQNIFKLIPNFGQEFEYIDARSRRSPSIENEESETETDHILLNDPFALQFSSPTTATTTSITSSATNIPKKDTPNVSLDLTSPKPTSLLDDKKMQLTSFMSKSSVNYSDNKNELFENAENNQNMINLHNSPLATTSTSYATLNKPTASFPLNGSFVHDLDLLTPVNEMCDTVSKHYATADILAGLYTQDDSNRAQESHCSSNSDYTPPKFAKSCKIMAGTPPGSKTIVTSTPDARKRSLENKSNAQQVPQTFNYNYVDGKYKGEAIHSDGNIIDIVYTISKHLLPSGQKIFCVWISRDPDAYENCAEDELEKQLNLTLTLNSLTSTIENSLGAAIKNTAGVSTTAAASGTSVLSTSANCSTSVVTTQASSRPNSVSLVSQCEEDQISGEYCKHYTTLKQIGKGAYGYVKMAYRNSDRLLVISKFILKDKLCPNFMIKTDEKKEIPIEIYLLLHVEHPNIVSVLDVFENEKFFQLIMEKHGSGMDLFEFIDRRPLIDEKLGCYIFRQIARAVNYLHSLNILHRDIKDENIIIDHSFHIKLIDFGSATFMHDGKVFSTFYGTTEYCSPEVLAGNKYKGPELEMWSLGVTLFVLMFFENPFLDVEDTLRTDLMIPHDVSKPLETLLCRMLDKDPSTRLTMRELMQHEWINQEIVNNFNFSWIVPCEPYEANPEVYYTGEAYSSATALSTSRDSLSMVDDDYDHDEQPSSEDVRQFAQMQHSTGDISDISPTKRDSYIIPGSSSEGDGFEKATQLLEDLSLSSDAPADAKSLPEDSEKEELVKWEEYYDTESSWEVDEN